MYNETKEIMKKRIFTFLMSLLCLASYGQGTTVTGRVISDEDGEGLPGVNVVIKDTSIGTVTDLQGQYAINAGPEDILAFSSVGYVTEEVLVGNQSVIDIVMVPDVTALSEIVVVGYGTQDEKDLTSAITTLSAEDLTTVPTGQAMQAVQGKVPGVQIVSNGAPGASPTVRVRGVGTFEGGQGPLYVVDGMFFDDIGFLNPNDIATMSVLKDASASAIYGVRAANGVILIETKTGNYNEAPEIVYDGYFGIQNPQNVIKMANSTQFVQYVNEVDDPADINFVNNAMQRFGRSRINPNIPAVNTDWYAEVMDPATIQNHSLSFNGGSEKTRYSIGMNYFDQQGLLQHTRNEYKRLNFRIKADSKVKDWLTVGGNFNVSAAQQYVGENAAWFSSYFAVPILPVYDPQNADAEPVQLSNAQLIGYRSMQNPFYSLLYQDNRNNVGKVLGSFYADFELIPTKLNFRTSYQYSMEGRTSRNVDFAYDDGVTENLSSLRRETFGSFDQVWDNFFTYNDNFGDHFLTGVLGYSYRSEYRELLFAEGEDLIFPLAGQEQFWYLSNAQNINVLGVGDAQNTFNNRLFYLSVFGRLAYNYDDRYLLYGTYRRDGNNKFQQTWGDFFTLGAGWVLSEEEFFDVDFIDFLKFRAGWGQLGNDAIAPSEGAPTIEDTETALGDVLVRGTRKRPIFDLVSQWETTQETNVGITARFFGSRLDLEADYYVRDTRDLAVQIVAPVFRGSERRSRGEIRNQGFELNLNWSDQISNDFSYRIGGNLATLQNEVLSLGGAEQLLSGSAEFRQISRIGEPYQAFYGYEINGVFQTESDISNSGYTQEFINDNNLEPGDYFFTDQNNDGLINDQDRVILGSFLPSLTYGFTIGATYRNFDFTAFFQGQAGHEILNRRRGEVIFTNDTNLDAELVNNLWRGEGTSNRYPSAAGLRKGWNQNFSDYFIESGSYFRIQNVRLSYNLSDTELFGLNMPETRITLTAERPLTIFDYNGFTPEVPDGVDRQTYPIPAIYTVGLNLRF
jgi:TonB-linked SusC/RagA family outer membrane protein